MTVGFDKPFNVILAMQTLKTRRPVPALPNDHCYKMWICLHESVHINWKTDFTVCTRKLLPCLQGLRTFVVTDYKPGLSTPGPVRYPAAKNETWAYYPDDNPVRSSHFLLTHVSVPLASIVFIVVGSCFPLKWQVFSALQERFCVNHIPTAIDIS